VFSESVYNLAKKVLLRNKGSSIFDRDWDSLIILDACRYDCFVLVAREMGLKEKIEKFRSLGSCTFEFLLNNFTGRRSDIVYVTANPYVSLLLKEKVSKIIPVWDFGWSDEYKTVLPETVYRHALKAALKYPRKKLIVHFMQPHEPFLSLHGYNLQITGISMSKREVIEGKMFSKADKLIWDLVRKRRFSRKKAINAYIQNIRIVYPYAIRLARILPGKTVITADHGEAFGERFLFWRIWSHPSHTYTKQLVEVPWVEINGITDSTAHKDYIRKELVRTACSYRVKV